MEAQLTTSTAVWPQVRGMIRKAMMCKRDFDLLTESVESGRSVPYGVWHGEELVAAYVCRLDDSGFLEVEAASGLPGFDLVERILPVIESSARSEGLPGVMVNTWRRGMVEKLGRAGYGTAHVRMVMEF